MKAMIKHIFLNDRMYMTRLGLAAGSMLWAIQLLLPMHLFPTATQLLEGKGRATYAIMSLIAPENVWGVLFLTHSVWAFYTLFTGARNKVTLAADGLLGCLLWTTSTIACFASYWPRGLPLLDAIATYPPPAAMSGEAVMAFYAWWHMIRVWADEECSHHHCRRALDHKGSEK